MPCRVAKRSDAASNLESTSAVNNWCRGLSAGELCLNGYSVAVACDMMGMSLLSLRDSQLLQPFTQPVGS